MKYLVAALSALGVMITILSPSPTLASTVDMDMVYTNRTSWEQGVSGLGLISTDTFLNEIINGATITLDSGITSTVNNPFSEIDNKVGANEQYTGGVGRGSAAPYETITWEFPGPVIAFSGDFTSTLNNGGQLAVTGNFDGFGNQTFLFSDKLTSLSGAGFIGIIGKSAFTSIEWSAEVAGSSELWSVDNFSFVAVPIPATLLLLGTGLVGLAGIRIKMKKN